MEVTTIFVVIGWWVSIGLIFATCVGLCVTLFYYPRDPSLWYHDKDGLFSATKKKGLMHDFRAQPGGGICGGDAVG